MRKIFLLVLFCTVFYAIAFPQTSPAQTSAANQCNCSYRKKPPYSKTSRYLRAKRCARYNKKRKRSNQEHLPDDLPYKVTTFRDAMQKIADNTDYDGFRIYFAAFPAENLPDSGSSLVPKGKGNSMTLIFVPTTGDAKNALTKNVNKKYHKDDTANCWILNGDKIDTIPAKFASLWVHKAQSHYLDSFQRERSNRFLGHKYKEAHLLWYSMKLVRRDPHSYRGLLDYLDCAICENRIDSVDMQFGAFLFTNFQYHYKLTIIFSFFKKGHKMEYFTLSTKGVPDAAIDTDTDTGKPCPPPNDGNCQQSGALLPCDPCDPPPLIHPHH